MADLLCHRSSFFSFKERHYAGRAESNEEIKIINYYSKSMDH